MDKHRQVRINTNNNKKQVIGDLKHHGLGGRNQLKVHDSISILCRITWGFTTDCLHIYCVSATQ